MMRWAPPLIDAGRLAALVTLLSLAACARGPAEPAQSSGGDHVLSGADLTGWEIVGQPALFDASTLYLHVNGEDGLYISAGFERLTSIELKEDRRGGATVVVDVYELGSTLSAFGIYSRLHDEAALVPGAGASACLFETLAVMYKNRYVVKITADPTRGSGDDRARLLTALIGRVAEALPGTTAPPCELACAAHEGLVAGSMTYVEQALNGHDFLPGGLQADYRIAGDEARLFLSSFPDAGTAAAAFQRYGEIMQDTVVPPERAGEREGQRIAGSEPDGTRTTVVVWDRFLVGIRGGGDGPTATALMTRTLQAIEDNAGCWSAESPQPGTEAAAGSP